MPNDAYFYNGVRWLYCHGAISGYVDHTFRPNTYTTRGQMVKIVSLAYNLPAYHPATPTFNDVPPTQTFYQYIENAAHSNVVSGYNCGAANEPCPGVYFRPDALVTRGQLTKIIVTAAGWALINPVNAHFNDVPRGSAFYEFIETAYCHSIISGYSCGGPGEPCDAQHRPYFRQNNTELATFRLPLSRSKVCPLGSGFSFGAVTYRRSPSAETVTSRNPVGAISLFGSATVAPFEANTRRMVLTTWL